MRNQDEFLSVQSIRHRAGEETEEHEGEGLEKARETQLERRARKLVDLIEAGDVTDLHRYCGQDA